MAVLPETETDGALAVAEDLRRAVEELAIPHAPSTTADHVTLSLGVASQVPIADQPLDGLLSRSDEALYRAKDEGRNRVCRD